VIDDGVNNSFLRIDDGVVAVLVVRRIDGVVVRNDKTDPDLPLCSRLHRRREQGGCSSRVAARAVDCPADESRGVQSQSWLLKMPQTRAMEEDLLPGQWLPH